MKLNSGSRTSVRINGLEGEKFAVNVGEHQGSVLSPLPFIIEVQCGMGLSIKSPNREKHF